MTREQAESPGRAAARSGYLATVHLYVMDLIHHARLHGLEAILDEFFEVEGPWSDKYNGGPLHLEIHIREVAAAHVSTEEEQEVDEVPEEDGDGSALVLRV